ncbi:hypothetical protein EV126DRAFT_419420 [Verticillium dahliae]|nr:hypothetical protein EV126DRAFT_419420 [Verticillium dahliae]
MIWPPFLASPTSLSLSLFLSMDIKRSQGWFCLGGCYNCGGFIRNTQPQDLLKVPSNVPYRDDTGGLSSTAETEAYDEREAK